MAAPRRTYARQIGMRKADILVDLNGYKIDSVDTLQDVLADNLGIRRFTIKRGQELLRMRLGG
jgi:hypothetical protein